MTTLYQKIEREWTENFLGYTAMAIVLSTCIGSVAIMTSVMQGNGFFQMFQVFLVVCACSIHNASILTVQKPSVVLKLLIASVLTSFLVMTFGVAFS
ncbi:hypothetical protein Q2T40_11500 [Winogradskyella maritima]|uniref:Uncharacterized protein n=1 Tax=Winogradskyella maritima TaxID=1517766 RepID=A0ABV8AL33_9FLAO|nr:hypothetical protein [Winogradskyella maritima]